MNSKNKKLVKQIKDYLVKNQNKIIGARVNKEGIGYCSPGNEVMSIIIASNKIKKQKV